MEWKALFSAEDAMDGKEWKIWIMDEKQSFVFQLNFIKQIFTTANKLCEKNCMKASI